MHGWRRQRAVNRSGTQAAPPPMRTAIATNARRAEEPCAAEICYPDAWVPPRIDANLSAIPGQHSDRRSARKQANARPLLLDHPERPQDHDLPRGGGARL